jgi:hypothetical protein
MTRKATRMMAFASVSMLIGIVSRPVLAEDLETDSTTVYTPASIDTSNALIPKRWCIDTRIETPSLATLFEARHRPDGPTILLAYTINDYGFDERFIDRSSFSYRLAELHSDRLVTFWKGNSFGIFLGITRGGFVSVSIAQ